MPNELIDPSQALRMGNEDAAWALSRPGFDFRILDAHLEYSLVVSEKRAQRTRFQLPAV